MFLNGARDLQQFPVLAVYLCCLSFSCLAQGTPMPCVYTPCPLCSSSHATSTLLREIVTGGGSAAGIEGNHGCEVGGGCRQRLGVGVGDLSCSISLWRTPSIMQSQRDYRSQELGSGTYSSQSDWPPPPGYELMAPPHGSPSLLPD